MEARELGLLSVREAIIATSEEDTCQGSALDTPLVYQGADVPWPSR